MEGEDLKDRTKRFALRVLKLVAELPPGLAGKTIGGQIVRCGTAVGANYRAACRSRSKKEFIAKIGIVEEEADETAFWLELLGEAGIMEPKRLEPLRQEAEEITRIMAASRKTAKGDSNLP